MQGNKRRDGKGVRKEMMMMMMMMMMMIIMMKSATEVCVRCSYKVGT
jgi:hypothetical protein